MKSRPGRGPAASEQTFPTATFTDTWRQQVGDEWMAARYYGAAHTSGDAVVTFERANVVHMGDLMFNRRQPVVDKPAGANFKNWIVGAREDCLRAQQRHGLHLRPRRR